MRVAILAPVHIPGLQRYFSGQEASQPLPTGMGGYCIVSLVEQRLKQGLPTDVITLDPTVSQPVMHWDGGLLRLWVVKRRAKRALRDCFQREVRLLQQALRESDPAICHANWTYEYGLAAVRQTDYPVVLTVHDHALHCLRWSGIRYLPLFLITQYVLRRARSITTVSPYVAEYLEGKLKRKIPVIPNLLPELVRAPGGGLKGDFTGGILKADQCGLKPLRTEGYGKSTCRVISAVTWSRLKNTKRALLAFRRAREICCGIGVDLEYVLIGPELGIAGPAARWAAARGCDGNVVFAGEKSYKESLCMIAAADLLMHPSLEESFAMPVAEAMAFGVPVMAAREAGGARWLLDEGRCGMLFSGRSLDSMTSAIVELASQHRIHNEDKARERIIEITDASIILRNYADVYQAAREAFMQKKPCQTRGPHAV